MKQNVDFKKYAYTKNVIYQLYPVLKTFNDSQLDKFFSTFGRLESIARNTYLFPYDLELFEDLNAMEIPAFLSDKYSIDSKLLSEKCIEYKFYEFGKLLLDSELLDLDSIKKFNYEETNSKK